MILEHLQSVKSIKKLSFDQLKVLAEEIRLFLINGLSNTGGHLASNLGVVELTIALHKVFQSPYDKIVWDVGHQSYVHKILTGRKDRFATLRRLDGLCGFPKSLESEHDAFNTGHSSTSISAALGLAAARDLKGTGKEKIIAVIGDGSMTGGLTYEALNNAGRANTDILVVVNDNQMSISENVGAVSRHLNEIRTAPFYLGAKEDVHQILDNLPLIGKPISNFIEQTKDAVKYLFVPGVMFEKLGFQYFGPVNGHDIQALTDVLRRIKNIRGPVMLHVLTVNGKGYTKAEYAPKSFHGVNSFKVETGEPVSVASRACYTQVFGNYMVKKAATDSKIVAITAAMDEGTGLTRFKKRYPRRFFDVGIAESHAVTFAAGLAKGGMKPVVAVYSSFLQRAYDQILHDVCIQNLPVVFAIDRAGLVGEDGETHQGIFDLSYLSHIPNITVLAPKNKYEFIQMLDFALNHKGPSAIRYPKAEAAVLLREYNSPLEYGRSETIFYGEEIAVVSVGAMMETALSVYGLLRDMGISAGLYNARFVKPMDMGLVSRLSQYKHIFTLEDNVRTGGYGSRLSEALALLNKPSPRFYGFAFPDVFVEQGTREELFKRYKLDAESITAQIINLRKG